MNARDAVWNLTAHPLTLFGARRTVTIEPSGMVARVRRDERNVGWLEADGAGVNVVAVCSGGVSGLPDPQLGVRLLVSRAVAEAAPDRPDLLVPYDVVYEDGRVIGCRSLSSYASAAGTDMSWT